ncbi:uncharacterized protein OCT59_008415 [Rhizophagus irregularis]|uniref:Kic1p n=2 Tax=Rhizophagus irregularis TaxID=588596 RepID=A0A015K5L7_RHIIW|nr:Kic1p [Rhizophagus irregularis DAOM 197198w]UZO17052.1 hypothetical protein OCT59_008415 [Rhizophagus irregularis]
MTSLNEWIDMKIKDGNIDYVEYSEFSNVEKVGEGAFGIVNSAHWKSCGIKIAIKILINNSSVDENIMDEFVKELKNLKKVSFHPNINGFFGISKEPLSNKYAMVLEYADQGNLREYLKIHINNLKWSDKIRMASDIVCGLKCLHFKHIIHRDLHAKNILVNNHKLMIADFGSSKQLSEATSVSANSENDIIGMIEYMEPQCFKNIEYKKTKKSDIYSLGVLLWEISSGRPPFLGYQRNILAFHIGFNNLREKPIDDGTPQDYQKLYQKCWDDEPNSRPDIERVYEILCQLKTENSSCLQSPQLSIIEIKNSNIDSNGDLSISDCLNSGESSPAKPLGLFLEEASINNFIQERQLKVKDHEDIVFEWISYNQFDRIKEACKNNFITVYSATWRDGPLYYQHDKYIRDSNKGVSLKFLHSSQNSIEFVINEVKKYSTKNNVFLVLYGISKNPNTNDYILVQNDSMNLTNWISGNEKIDDFIQERQLKINGHEDVIFEWIPYNQFNKIEEIGKNNSITVYSAIWKNGPLYYQHDKYTRDSNKEVALKFLHNSQNLIESVINKAKKYSTKNDEFLALYGISQNPNTNDYILVLFSEEYCVICDEIYTDVQYKWCKPCKFMGWKSGNDEIDNLLIQLKIDEPSDIKFKWIPFNQFNRIRNIGKGHFVTVCSAIWKYEVALLCYNDSQKFLDKVKEFDKNFNIYGLSQN